MFRRLLACSLLATLAVVISLSGAACAKRHRFSIDSDTCWSAAIDDQTGTVANDCGNATFRVAGDFQCVRIRNLTDTGYVRVRIDDGPWVATSGPQGTAKVCR